MGSTSWWSFLRPVPVDEERWVVVDVETTGLDPGTDELLAIAGVALRIDWVGGRAAIEPADSFEVVVQLDNPTLDRANILLHGIGMQRQREGVPPVPALDAFAAFVGKSPLLAFHAGFDEAVLRRTCKRHQGRALTNPWADIEFLCAASFGEVAAGGSLDHWMEHLGIECARRHQAAADAMAEAEILLRLWPRLSAECRSWADVARLSHAQRWLKARKVR